MVIEPQAGQCGEQNSETVLVAEDSAFYRHLIGRLLAEWGFGFTLAKDGKEAWNLLDTGGTPKLALLDWVLPEVDGIELCRRLRARSDDKPYTYTILLTGKNERREMLQAMDAGADDFLAKPFNPLELKARLMAGKRIVDLHGKLETANKALLISASHDFLTGLWNRAEIVAFLRRELGRAQRDRNPIGIVLVDVDNFKNINDTLGHETGDSVLIEIAQRLSAGLRPYDGVGRYGGEEFLLVAPGCDLGTTVQRANQIREAIADQPILTRCGGTHITASMGVTVAQSSTDEAFILRLADQALYQAKHRGRNRVEHALPLSRVSTHLSTTRLPG